MNCRSTSFQIRNRPWLPLAFIGQLMVAPPLWGQSAPACPGPTQQRHPYGNFNFETNSRVDDTAFRHYKHGLVTCVSNNDKDNPLYMRWFIPGPRGWVQPGDKLESVPRLIEDTRILQFQGCLEYGNRGDTTAANFMGTATDQKSITHERALGCLAAATTSSDFPEGRKGMLEDLFLKFRNFFPSNARNPKETMLQLDGEVGVRTIEPNGYRSYFKYVLTPYNDSKGIAQRLVLRPAFRGSAAVLLQAFHKDNGEIIKMGQEGTVSFEVTGLQNPELRYASYEVYDENNQVVGAIDFPVFVSSTTAADLRIVQNAPVRLRGTIEAIDGPVLTVKSRDGTNYMVKLTDNAAVRSITKAALSDIKDNSFIGVTGTPQADGSQKAVEIHIFPEPMRGTGEGHRPWDLVPSSTMTNATVAQMVQGVSGNEITLKYKDGEKKIIVTPQTQIVTYAPGDKSDLKPGAKIFIAGANKSNDGTLEAAAVSVGRDGLTPPM